MKRLLALIAVLALVAGCTSSPIQRVITRTNDLVLPDAVAGADVLAKSAPILPAGDPWPGCYATIIGVLTAIQAGPGTPETVNGLLTEAARIHVLDSLLQNASATPGQQSCAQIILSIQLRAAAGATPFGALLPLR